MTVRSVAWQRCVAVVLAGVVIGCDAAQPTLAPGSQAAPGSPAATTPAETQPGLGGTAGPAPTHGSAEPIALAPLPTPSMTDPSEIGIALYDPNRLPDALMSLFAEFGVEVVGSDGSRVLDGTDVGLGSISMTEAQVRGWIEMTRDDIIASDGGSAITVRELYDALAPSLPADYTLGSFTSGYQQAFDARPDGFAPSLMLGQPIEPGTGLMRIQAWVLLVDAFLGRETEALGSLTVAGARREPPRGVYAAARSSVAVSRSYQPPLTSQIRGMSDAAWAYLVSMLPTLAYTISFTTWPPSAGVHEGHGGTGNPATIVADVVVPPPLVFPQSGSVLLEPHASPAGVSIEWSSTHPGTLTWHGSLDRNLLSPVILGANGTAAITYTPKKEVANGRGLQVKEVASLFAQANAADLIRNVYFTALSQGATDAVVGLARGTVRSTRGQFTIFWHEKDTYEVTIRNRYDVYLDVGTGTGSLVDVHRVGLDSATGTLYNNGDGTYQGTLDASVVGTMDGVTFVGDCHDRTDARQQVYVVGHPIGGMGVLPPFLRIDGGTYAQKDLILHFYPASPPSGSLGPCQGTLDFPGGGPDGQPAGVLLPFNDTRWTAIFNTTRWQDLLGVRILLPTEGTLDVTDTRQVIVESRVDSRWSIQVTKPPPP